MCAGLGDLRGVADHLWSGRRSVRVLAGSLPTNSPGDDEPVFELIFVIDERLDNAVLSFLETDPNSRLQEVHVKR